MHDVSQEEMDRTDTARKPPLTQRELSAPIAALIVVLALLAVGALGWYTLDAPNRGPNGQDLSRPAVQPAGARGPR